MPDYNADIPNAVKPGWLNYRDGIESVAIESGVTGIGDYAFVDCANLTEISVPASLESIDETAFEGASNLTFFCKVNGNGFPYAMMHGFTYVLAP